MSDRPSIFFIFTDQQSESMMSCAGNPYLHTPAMDSLAETGMRFDKAYCTIPVCLPSRFSLLTGRMPSEIGLRDNNHNHIESIPANIQKSGAGTLLRNAGYDVAYGGKVHLPKMGVVDLGFDYICKDERDELADSCVEYLQEERAKPFFLTASFINPHDICYMAIRDFGKASDAAMISHHPAEIQALDEALQLPEGVSTKEFFDTQCPPLPDNHEPQADEPEAVLGLLTQRTFKIKARENYSEKQWRLHRWAYCKLTESVDAQIARVLEALRSTGQDKNTVIIFSSDHGDLDSSHKMEHKTAFYEEACRIPLIVNQPGVTKKGLCSELVSNGLDLIPTLCDYAGIDVPAELKGKSFRPLAEGKMPDSPREYVPIENEIGRMIVTKEYKYMLHDEGKNKEQLIDLKNDPGEMRNAITDPELAGVLKRHRTLFEEQFD